MKPNFKDYVYSFLETISGWIIILSVIHFFFFLFVEIAPILLKKTLRHEKPDFDNDFKLQFKNLLKQIKSVNSNM